MAKRQQNLFAAEDWKIAYKAYSQVNYQAYDFDTMRKAMVDYVRTNYPENFNDYIESSEFITIIELLAYLSQSLAFRMDLNSRENFLETAERKDSVFKLARMLGYNPKRNLPASGLVKLVSIKTSEPIADSFGNNLSNRTIYWEDANNPDAYEQFITILNSSMSSVNRFTSPIKTGTVGGVKTEMYQLNTPFNAPITYNTELSINGTKRNFNIVNPDFDDNQSFYERNPNPRNLFNLIYRNDGKGNSSSNTGFFAMFRQGDLQFQDFNYTTPVANRTEDVNVQNINELDVYLQEINSSGVVLSQWERIPNTVGQTLNYNSKTLETRNLYSVETLGTGGIRLRFPDGNFGNVPSGIYRLWYRTSDPVRYTMQPEDAKNISIVVPYVNNNGQQYSLTATFSLQYSVANSFPAETLEAIKERAPQTFYTQNRMVSAQDYNVFPQGQSGNVTKIKAINRTHAGHSRYIDLSDPTGTYHNVDTFANDAYLYKEESNLTDTVLINNDTKALEVASSVIPAKLADRRVTNFVYSTMRDAYVEPAFGGNFSMFKYDLSDAVVWNPLPLSQKSKIGYITEQFSTGDINILTNNTPDTKIFKENSFLKMVDPNNQEDYNWVRIVKVENSGALTAGLSTSLGPYTLSDEIPAGWELREVVVSMRKQFTNEETALIKNEILKKKTFGIGYNLTNDTWYIIPNTDLSSQAKTGKYKLDGNNVGPNSWVVLMQYSVVDVATYKYQMTVRGTDYVVQSENDLKFYNVKGIKSLGSNNRSDKDTIIFTRINGKSGIGETFEWTGEAWKNTNIGYLAYPFGVRANIPLRTRDTKATDVQIEWISNFGILDPVSFTAPGDIATNNRYVNDAVVSVHTYHSAGGIRRETNVVIANNSGMIQSLPSKIEIPFGPNTFGKNIVVNPSGEPYIVYRQLPDNQNPGNEVIFRAVAATVYEDVNTEVSSNVAGSTSWGDSGLVENTDVNGRLLFKSYNRTTGQGVLEYIKVQNNDFHSSSDGSANPASRDKFTVYYENSQERLDKPIHWEIADSYRETDGYTDGRKVKVVPLDSDSDGVPDRPLQFKEFVDSTDNVFFEYYKDFDGYTYDRPFNGVIRDFRRENDVVINDSLNYVSPSSYDRKFTLSEINWVVVKNLEVAKKFENKVNTVGLILYVVEEDKVYQITPLSTQTTQAIMVETQDYFVKPGRGKNQNTASNISESGIVRWNHIAPSDVRIDPSISNVVEMLVLTSSYYERVLKWQARPIGTFPLEPTSDQLSLEFDSLNTYKSASDTLVYRSAKFKLLFGPSAAEELKARFRVVKLSDQISDNELKAKIINAINAYFEVSNWDFGETFYFTELSTYIHQKLGSSIGSIVILPKQNTGKFGGMFQVKAEPNELFINTATVQDIEIVSRLDNQTLRTDI